MVGKACFFISFPQRVFASQWFEFANNTVITVWYMFVFCAQPTTMVILKQNCEDLI